MKNEDIVPCMQKLRWRRLSLAVDSGACYSVVGAERCLPDPEVKETKASESGPTYASATGEDIPNLGELTSPYMTKEKTRTSMSQKT